MVARRSVLATLGMAAVAAGGTVLFDRHNRAPELAIQYVGELPKDLEIWPRKIINKLALNGGQGLNEIGDHEVMGAVVKIVMAEGKYNGIIDIQDWIRENRDGIKSPLFDDSPDAGKISESDGLIGNITRQSLNQMDKPTKAAFLEFADQKFEQAKASGNLFCVNEKARLNSQLDGAITVAHTR